MNYIIVGLGNPGQEYEWTRHNTGRMVVDAFAKLLEIEEFEMDKKINSLVAKTKVGKNTVTLVKPETFMNKSGNAVGPLVKSKKAAETLVVIHDELDIPFGKMKMSFNKSAGGHRGVASVVKAVKTEAFIRLRVGISPATAGGKMKKPQGEEAVIDLILSKFKPAEQIEFKKLAKKAAEGLEILVKDGREIATGFVNSL
jgi:PTH1 family peptidyl-tRNA hydrolase